MLGWKILRHAIGMVLRNIKDAIRIGWLLVLISLVLSALSTPAFIKATQHPDPTHPFAAFSPGFLVAAVFSWFAFLWIAVAWHRFVLLQERPGLILPAFHGRQILSYFGRGVLVGLILIAVAIPLEILATVIVLPGVMASGTVPTPGAAVPLVLIVSVVILGVPLSYIYYRLCLVLPAAAIGKPLRLGQSWAMTKKATGGIWLVVIAVVLVSVLNGLVNPLLGFGLGGTILRSLIGFVLFLFGISFMTTLYGYLVEGRELA